MEYGKSQGCSWNQESRANDGDHDEAYHMDNITNLIFLYVIILYDYLC